MPRLPKTCSVPSCDRPKRKRAWCQTHYSRWYHHGSVKFEPDPDLPNEEWRPVVGFENIYAVSDKGRVRRIGSEGKGVRIGRVLKPTVSATGYDTVSLVQPGTRKRLVRGVHGLVARAFIGEPGEGEEVNHKDGVKRNNHPQNLEWVTHAGNVRHGFATGLTVSPKGEKHGRSKLTAADVRAIRRLYPKVNGPELGRRFGVTAKSIYGVVHRLTWRHIK